MEGSQKDAQEQLIYWYIGKGTSETTCGYWYLVNYDPCRIISKIYYLVCFSFLFLIVWANWHATIGLELITVMPVW